MITPAAARQFAEAWIAAWNARDLEAVLSHYTDDFELTSPFIAKLMNDPTGTLRGKERVRPYWQRALDRFPDLHFTVIDVFTGAASLTLLYQSVQDTRAAETFFLTPEGKVHRAAAHYDRI
jgi:ketosteroid isomerase-like protein